MAGMNDFYTALRNADAAGDVDAARKIAAYIKSQLAPSLPSTPEAPKEEAGFFGAFKESLAQPAKIGAEAAAFGASDTPETRAALIKAGESKYAPTPEFGEGNNWQALKELAGGSLGQMVAPLVAGSAAAAPVAGTILGAPLAPIVGGAAAFTVGSAQYAAQNLLRTAQEQQAAIDQGKAPNPVDLGKMFMASAGESGLDLLEVGVFKRLFKALPFTGKLLGKEGEEAAKEASEQIGEAASKGKFSYSGGIAKGFAKGTAFEVPQEIAQQALERWQAGLSLSDEDAQHEYKQAAIGALVLGGLAGGAQGVLHTATEKAKATLAEAPQEEEQAPAPEAAPALDAPPPEAPAAPAEPIAPPAAPYTKEQDIEVGGLYNSYQDALSQAEAAEADGDPEQAKYLRTQADNLLEMVQSLDAKYNAQAQQRAGIPAGQTEEGGSGERTGLPVQHEEAGTAGAAGSGSEGLGATDLPAGVPDAGTTPVQGKLKFQRGETDREENKTWYRSALFEAARDSKVNKAPAKDWLALLRKPGVKDEEIQATGVEDWLKSQTGSVTKAEVADYIKKNGFRLQEVTSEEGGGNYSRYIQKGPKENYREFLLLAPNKEVATQRPNFEIYNTDHEYSPLDYMPEDITTREQAEQFALDWYNENLNETRRPVYILPRNLQVLETRVPGYKDAAYQSVHWKEPNVIAHIRTTDRVDANGKKTLFVEEVQSDWGQGIYAHDKKEKLEAEREQLKSKISKTIYPYPEMVDESNAIGASVLTALEKNSPEEIEKFREAQHAYKRIEEIKEDLRKLANAPDYRPPTGPFVEDTGKWTTLALKKILTHAAEQGYDKIAFIKGEQANKSVSMPLEAAKKYYESTLPSQLKSLITKGGMDGRLETTDIETERQQNDYHVGVSRNAPNKKLERFIENFIKSIEPVVKNEYITIGNYPDNEETANLVSGRIRRITKEIAEDPRRLESYARRYLSDYENINEILPFVVNNTAARYIVYDNTSLASVEFFDTRAEAEKWIDSNTTKIYSKQLSVTITPKMRDILMGGMPLFRRGTKGAKAVSVESAKRVVDAVVKNWKNAPKIIVSATVKDLPGSYKGRVPADTTGFYDATTNTVHIIAENADSESSLKGTVFHESLGHFGLQEEFGDRLDSLLKDIYKSNSPIRNAANAWLKANPDTYADLEPAEQKLRAVEEVLAERSEAGPIKEAGLSGAFNRIAALVREFMRKIGLVQSYSNNDIAQVLRRAHQTVTGGTALAPKEGKGLRFQQQQGKATLNSVKGKIMSQPVFDSEVAKTAYRALSKLPGPLAKAGFAVMSLHQMAMTFANEKALPSIRKFIEPALEARIREANKNSMEIAKQVTDWDKLIKKPANAVQQKTFNDVVMAANLYQVDPATAKISDLSNEYRKEKEQLLKDYASLNPEMKKLFGDLREQYENYSRMYLAAVQLTVSADVFQAIKKAFAEERLTVYFPLFRRGNYWLKYIDKVGEEHTESFTSPYDRKVARKEAEAAGARANTVREYSKLADFRRSNPPVGLFRDIINKMEKAGATDEQLDSIYEAYLNYLPSQSVRQQFRARKEEGGRFGKLGAEYDALQVYANMAPRLANSINKAIHTPSIDEAMEKLTAEFKNDPTEAKRNAVENIKARIDALNNPSINAISNGINTFTYFNTLVMNPSSALINLSALPMMVIPLLSGKYGYNQTTRAMGRATKMYWSSSWERGGEAATKDNKAGWYDLPDRTFGTGAKGAHGRLFKALLDGGAIVQMHDIDLGTRQQTTTGDYTGKRAKIMHGMSWIFRNSERMNREVTALAAFDLAHNIGINGKKLGEKEAIAYAVETVKDAHGSGFTSLGPTLFQSPIGKVLGLYKRFALNQIYLVSRLFHQAFVNADKETQNIARKQLLGVMGITFAFAGAQGLPLVGAGMVLSRFLMSIFGNDDEPFDPDAFLRIAIGDLAYKGPLNKLIGADVASRVGFTGLLWRDDPKKIADEGLPLYIAQQLAGPSWGMINNYHLAAKQLADGQNEKALETIAPVAIKNMMKGIRYGVEGALNKDGAPIAENVDKYDALLQLFGFNPLKVAEARQQAGAMKQADIAIAQVKASLFDKFYAASEAGDEEGLEHVIELIGKFNERHLNKTDVITGDKLRQSIKARQRAILESVDGVHLDKNRRQYLIENYGAGPEEEEEDEED